MVKTTLQRKGKGLAPLIKQLKALAKKEVYVGISQEEASRPDGGINNAELLYIQTHGVRHKAMREEMQKHMNEGHSYSRAHSLYLQEHGSPAFAIPPRPVLEPAIKANKEQIGAQLKEAAKAIAAGNTQEAEQALELAGMTAQNAARSWFDNPANGWAANSPKTIKQKGSDHPLIDTGELRKAITYVIRDRE